MTRSPRVIVCSAVALVVLVASCSGGDDDSDAATSTLSSTSIVDSTTPDSTTPDSTTPDSTTPDTEPATTPASAPATSAPSTTSAESTTPSTAPAPVPASTAPPTPATTAAPDPVTTTTELLATQELVLRDDGLGSMDFGEDADVVIDYVSSILGGTTNDSDWGEPFLIGACPGTEARRVGWGVLALVFSDESNYASGRRHFFGWEYGTVGELGEEPVGLRTEQGTTLGDSIADLRAAFPDAQFFEGDEDLGFPAVFFVSDEFSGLATGIDDDDTLTVLFGGQTCGE